MSKPTISRDDFVRMTIANTLGAYLQRYCAPWTIAQAQAKCIQGAEELADTMYGTLTVVSSEPQLESKPTSMSQALRRIR